MVESDRSSILGIWDSIHVEKNYVDVSSSILDLDRQTYKKFFCSANVKDALEVELLKIHLVTYVWHSGP
jgi:hypothetical protein